VSQLAFAFGAGMLATVNPCGFAMLPAFLAFRVGAEDDASRSTPQRLAQGLRVGLVVSAGFAGVFTVAGLLVALGLRSLVSAVPWVAVVIGAVLVVLGLAMLAGRHVGLTINASGLSGAGAGLGRMAAFGAAYALTSLSCTLAVLLAVVAQALATASLASTLAVFAAYGAGAATVLMLLALSAAMASGALARSVRRLLPVASRLGGAVLTLSGLYLVAYWAPVLAGDRSGTFLTNGGGRLSGAVTNLVEGHQSLVLAAAVAAVATAVAVRLLAGGRNAGSRSADGGDCCGPEAGVETTHHQGDTHA
jgi:cytochrome c-type biogenesis protein